MGEPNQTVVGTEEPDAEVELSAQDLRELSEARHNNEQECGLEGPTVPEAKGTATAAVPNASAPQMHDAPAPVRDVTVSRLSFSLVVIACVGALYVLMASSDNSAQPVAQGRVELAHQPAWSESESGPKIKGEPVLFANPFDPHEVFEFPPGTSGDEARGAVAQVLMDRAMERQSQFDTRVSNNH